MYFSLHIEEVMWKKKLREYKGKFQNYPDKNTLVNWCKENNFLWEIEQDIFICKKI